MIYILLCHLTMKCLAHKHSPRVLATWELYLCVHPSLSPGTEPGTQWDSMNICWMTRMSKAWRISIPKCSRIWCCPLTYYIILTSDRVPLAPLSMFLGFRFSGFCSDPSLCPALGTPATLVTASTTSVQMALGMCPQLWTLLELTFYISRWLSGNLQNHKNISVGRI